MEDVKDIHEAIISKDIFIQVQEEMLRRANMFSGEGKKKSEFIQASMPYPAFVCVQSVVIFTGVLSGALEVNAR